MTSAVRAAATLLLLSTTLSSPPTDSGRPGPGYRPRFRDFVGVNDSGGSAAPTLDALNGVFFGVTAIRPRATGADWGPSTARPFAWGGVQPARGLWDWQASGAVVAAAALYDAIRAIVYEPAAQDNKELAAEEQVGEQQRQNVGRRHPPKR
jgi:hypothetical protein